MLEDTEVYFDGNSLAALTGASLIDHNFNDLAAREIRTYKLARANKSITTSAEYSQKEVTIDFHLRGCDRSEAEQVLTDLKSFLRGVSKDLIVSQGDIDTTYSGATLNQINYRWFSNKIILTLVFEVANPIGYENTDTELLDVNVTSATSTSAIDVDGSFDALPIISLDYTTVTGGTSGSVILKNEETGQGLTIEADFASSDTLEIDSNTKTVVMNGAEIDYSGTFPVFAPNTGAFGYVDDFTTRDVDIVITYNRRFA